MEQVMRVGIPIQIRNVLNLDNQGTMIIPDSSSACSGSVSSTKATPFSNFTSQPEMQLPMQSRNPTAITVKPSILVLNVHSNKRSLSHGFFASIFSILDKWRLSIDLISNVGGACIHGST